MPASGQTLASLGSTQARRLLLMSLTADFNQMNVLPHLKPREKYVNLQAVSSLQRRRRSGGKKKRKNRKKESSVRAIRCVSELNWKRLKCRFVVTASIQTENVGWMAGRRGPAETDCCGLSGAILPLLSVCLPLNIDLSTHAPVKPQL